MKRIAQFITSFTLILDVVVIFTFGLAVISSFEDGSRLPETTFVRKASEGRVAGITDIMQISIASPDNGAMLNGPVTLKARTNVAAPAVYFNVKHNSTGNAGYMAAFLIPDTILDWQKDNLNMPNDSYSIFAEARSLNGSVLATSSTITISISNISGPSVMLNSPVAGTITGIKDIGGTLSNFLNTYSLPIKELQVWQGTTWKKNFPLARDINNSNNLISSMDTNTLVNGDYTLKIHLVYNDGTSDKTLDSGPVSVTVSNTSTTVDDTITQPAPSIVLSAPSGGTIGGSVPINGALSNFSTSYSIPIKELQVWQGTTWKKNFPLTRDVDRVIGSMDTNALPDGDYTLRIHLVYNDGTSDKTLDSGPVSVTVSNANTAEDIGTSNDSQTTTLVKPSIVFPLSGMILRRADEKVLLSAEGGSTFSKVIFAIRKTDETVSQYKDASFDSESNTWKYGWDLRDYKDWDYEIKAVGKTNTEEKTSDPVTVAVQKFSFKWLAPNNNDKLSGNIVLKSEINGIYEKDNKTPVKDMIVEFWQTGVKAPYPVYNGRAQQKPGTHEWFYEWKTANSSDGQYRLEVKMGNNMTNNYQGSLYATEPLFVEVSNRISLAPSPGSSNSNVNQNTNSPANTNSNLLNTNKAVNSAINSSSGFSQNSNISAVSNINSNSSSTSGSNNQADSDNDGLSDEKEMRLGTNPNSNDSDGDGLFDREEVEVYGANPLKTDSDGDGYNDFEEIQSGHDPINAPADSSAAVLLKPKPIEGPKNVEKPILETLVVEKIENKPLPPPENTNNPEPPPDENIIILKGKGPANTILTLFIYSVDPLVITVKTDDDGNWEYELDKKLEDGEHELYVTVTDDTGKIQSQSNPIAFFVKEAKAVSPENYRADLAAREPLKTSSTDIYLIASGVLVLIAAIAGLAVALRRKSGA